MDICTLGLVTTMALGHIHSDVCVGLYPTCHKDGNRMLCLAMPCLPKPQPQTYECMRPDGTSYEFTK